MSNVAVLENDRQRALVDLLRSHGVDKHVELPQIAVMGDTSSGKSSVLSALSGIQFPSSDRLCTRCPTQLQLTQADTFQGSVYIQRYMTPNTATSTETSHPTTEHRVLASLDEVSQVIEELTETIIKEEDGPISDDAIVIHAQGPHLPNLTLIDLPGLVRAVGDGEDASIIPRIRALVQRYLGQERTIILAVVPANVDMHNTEILQAAKNADPEGHRTISVLTKLDLVDRGAEASVIELLENRTKKLKLGYHAVRCRGQHDLNNGLSIGEGLTTEKDFFDTHEDWRRVAKSLVGTVNLKAKLSSLLEEHIEASLPLVQREIRSQLDACKADLANMGPPLDSNSERRLMCERSMRGLEQTISNAIKGNYQGTFFDHFLGTIDDEKESSALMMTFDPRLRSKINSFERAFRDSISITHVACYGNIRKGDKVIWHKESQEEDPEGSEWVCVSDSDATTGSFKIESSDPDNNHVIDVAGIEMAQVSFPTEDMERMLNENRGEQLCIFPNYAVFTRLVASRCHKWLVPMQELSSNTHQAVGAFMKQAIDFVLPPFPRFRDMIEQRLRGYFTTCLSNLTETLTSEMSLECNYQSTLNHYLYDSLIKLRTEPLLQTFEEMCDEDGKINLKHALAVLKNFGVGLKSNEKQEAIEMQFALAAYMKIAKKRFIDAIPRIIQNRLLRPISENMISDISITDEELEKVLGESASVRARRQHLSSKKQSLEEAERAFSQRM